MAILSKTIILCAGEYKEEVVITVSVNIENELGASKPAVSKVKWSGDNSNTPIIRIKGDASVRLTGVTLENNSLVMVHNGWINARACKLNGSVKVSGGFGAVLEDCHF